jgi:hypothetical protein
MDSVYSRLVFDPARRRGRPVFRPGVGGFAADASSPRRKALHGGENRLSMLKRWREKRKLIELAKLWAALDAAAPR